MGAFRRADPAASPWANTGTSCWQVSSQQRALMSLQTAESWNMEEFWRIVKLMGIKLID